MQLDWKWSRGCKSSVAITTKCWRHHASRNVSWPQRAPSAVGRETAVAAKYEAPAQTATGEPGMPLWTWHALEWVANGVRIFPRHFQLVSTMRVPLKISRVFGVKNSVAGYPVLTAWRWVQPIRSIQYASVTRNVATGGLELDTSIPLSLQGVSQTDADSDHETICTDQAKI